MATSKCTYIFAAINRTQRKIRPVMLRITAGDERSARRQLAGDYVLLFAVRRSPAAGRLSCVSFRNTASVISIRKAEQCVS
ncbi:host cell division inhibitor Icd-like protein [Serratia quinivorans]|uniref:host cell division inhibitor Icd-like protein n=1 Tax=Serratia quinivorans TaxID=137545 RepID=UPI0034C6A3C3